MEEIRAPLWWVRPGEGTQFFENMQRGILLRLSEERINEDTRFVIIRAIIYPDESVQAFMGFLFESVVHSPNGRVSGRKLWDAWAARHSVESAAETKEIAGVIEHFRDAFDAGEQVRRRLDGVVQWVWLGYELK